MIPKSSVSERVALLQILVEELEEIKQPMIAPGEHKYLRNVEKSRSARAVINWYKEHVLPKLTEIALRDVILSWTPPKENPNKTTKYSVSSPPPPHLNASKIGETKKSRRRVRDAARFKGSRQGRKRHR